MMNIFPVMYLSLAAYALLRVIAGSILVYFGFSHWQKRQSVALVLSPRFGDWASLIAMKLAIVELVIGLAFIAGFYTQIAAICAIIFALKMLIFRRTLTYPLVPSPSFYILLIGVSACLFVTGAGAFAFDLPI